MSLLRFSVVVALSVMVLASPTEARRRGGIGFMSIPTGEKIVKVLDFPDTPLLKREDGKYIDLGYRFSRSGDKWVGYIGSDSTYLDLTESQLNMLMSVAGVNKLPPIPKKPLSAALGGGLYYFLFGLGILTLLFKFGLGFMRVVGGSARAVNATSKSLSSAVQLPQKSYNEAMGDDLDRRIAEAAAAYNNSGMSAPSAQSAPAQNHAPQQSFGRAPATTFGRRT